MAAQLPTPRALITSLINSLPPAAEPQDQDTRTTTSTNPLKSADPKTRSLLITLHALFPDIFLKALDLLDRGLVTHIIQETPTPLPDGEATSDERTTQQPESNKPTQQAKFYLVRSSQDPRNRHRSSETTHSSATGKAYIVRTTAWNCSCAAFAFSAFPSSIAGSGDWKARRRGHGGAHGYVGRSDEAVEKSWEFGGCSFDGRDGGNVPCCKHFLACVLAERWSVLGGYVRQRKVGREEMAGLIADL